MILTSFSRARAVAPWSPASTAPWPTHGEGQGGEDAILHPTRPQVPARRTLLEQREKIIQQAMSEVPKVEGVS